MVQLKIDAAAVSLPITVARRVRPARRCIPSDRIFRATGLVCLGVPHLPTDSGQRCRLCAGRLSGYDASYLFICFVHCNNPDFEGPFVCFQDPLLFARATLVGIISHASVNAPSALKASVTPFPQSPITRYDQRLNPCA
jgi:hypothetical protein